MPLGTGGLIPLIVKSTGGRPGILPPGVDCRSSPSSHDNDEWRTRDVTIGVGAKEEVTVVEEEVGEVPVVDDVLGRADA